MDKKCSKCGGNLVQITKIMGKCVNCRSIEKFSTTNEPSIESIKYESNESFESEKESVSYAEVHNMDDYSSKDLTIEDQLAEILKDEIYFTIIAVHYSIRKKVFENFNDDDEVYETIIDAINGDIRAMEHIILFPSPLIERMIDHNIIEYPESIERLKRMSFNDNIRFLSGFTIIQSVLNESSEEEEVEYLLLLSEKATSKLCIPYIDPSIKLSDVEEKCRTLAKTYIYTNTSEKNDKSRVEIPVFNHYQDAFELNDNIYDIIDRSGDPIVIIELKQYILRLEKYIDTYLKDMKNILEFFQNGLSQDRYIKKFDESFTSKRKFGFENDEISPSVDYIQYISDKLKRLPRRIKPNLPEGIDLPKEYLEWKNNANIFIELYLTLIDNKKNLRSYIKKIFAMNPFRLLEIINKKTQNYLEINELLLKINNNTRAILKIFNKLKREINIVELGNRLDEILDSLITEEE